MPDFYTRKNGDPVIVDTWNNVWWKSRGFEYLQYPYRSNVCGFHLWGRREIDPKTRNTI